MENSEGAVSHNVLYHQPLPITHHQERIYANNYFVLLPMVSTAFKPCSFFLRMKCEENFDLTGLFSPRMFSRMWVQINWRKLFVANLWRQNCGKKYEPGLKDKSTCRDNKNDNDHGAKRMHSIGWMSVCVLCLDQINQYNVFYLCQDHYRFCYRCSVTLPLDSYMACM